MGDAKPFNNRLGNASAFQRPDMPRAGEIAARFVERELRDFRERLESEGCPYGNEPALTEGVVLHLNGARSDDWPPFIFLRGSMENRVSGSSPAVDIGVFWQLPGRASFQWPRVSAIEAKRLDASLPKDRRCEYVFGHQKGGKHIPCGGIERYKKDIHGSEITSVVMLLGYLQSENPDAWWERINGWVADLAGQSGHTPAWSENEQLGPVSTTSNVTKCESIINRAETTLKLVHIWLDITNLN